MSRLERLTTETQVALEVERREGPISVETPDPFLTHMLQTLARYAGLRLDLRAAGDLRHHVVEDVAITLGLALAEEVPQSAARYGWALVPMDDALVQAAVDLGGRAWYQGRLPSKLYQHFLQSFAFNLRVTMHVRVLRGRDRHHIVEAAFKAVGLALRQALEEKPGDAFSTKGSVRLRHGQGGRRGVRGGRGERGGDRLPSASGRRAEGEVPGGRARRGKADGRGKKGG